MIAGILEIQITTGLARLQSDMNQVKSMVGSTMDSVKSSISSAKTALAALGVGAVGAAFSAYVNRTIEFADRLNDLRTRSGQTGQELLVMEGAAIRGGVAFEAVSDVVSKLAKRLGPSELATGEAAKGFAAIGMSATNADGSLKKINEIMLESGKIFATFEDGLAKDALAVAIFGKGGDRLIPMIESLEEVEKRFKRLGITIDEDLITAADQFKDSMADMQALNDVFARQLVSQLLPYLQQLVNFMIELKSKSNEAHSSIDKLVSVVKLGAAAFYGMYTAIASVAEVFVGLELAKSIFLTGGGIKAATDAVSQGWENAKKRVEEYATFVSRLDIMGASVNPFTPGWGDEEKERRRQAPGLPDLKGMDAARKALQSFLDEEAKLKLAALKEGLTNSQAILDAEHSQNLIGEQDYWTSRLQIQQAAFGAERGVLQGQMSQLQKVLSTQKEGTKDYFETAKSIMDVNAKRNKVESDAAQAATLDFLSRRAAAEQYKQSIESLNIRLLTLKGLTVDAAVAQQALSSKQLAGQALANNDSATLAKLAEEKERVKAQAEFNDLLEKRSDITARLALEEQRLQDTARTGAMGNLTLMLETEKARRQAVNDVEATDAALRRIAESQGNPRMTLQMEQSIAAVKRLRSESELLAEKFNTVFGDSFSSAFADFISGSKTAAEAFKSFSTTVVNEINKMAGQEIAKSIFGGSSSGKGAGGILAGLFSGSSGLNAVQGPTQSGGNLTDSGGIGNLLTSIGGWIIGKFEQGSDYIPRTGLALVHEGEAIIPKADNRRVVKQVSLTVVQQFPRGTDKQTMTQSAAAASRELNRAARNL